MNPKVAWTAAALLFATAPLAGCGGNDGPETVPVSGTVEIDGKPLDGAEVNFFSETHNFLSTGVTDEEGNYQLYQGAALGENKVWISKLRKGAQPAGDPAENPELDVAQIEARSIADTPIIASGDQELPEKFSNPDETVLKFMVPEDGTESASFKLTSE